MMKNVLLFLPFGFVISLAIISFHCHGEELGAASAVTIPLIHSATPNGNPADMIAEAFEHNPDIEAARAEWAQVVETYPLETAWEDPMLTFSYYVENVETRVGPQKNSFNFVQRFPFPGTLRQKGRVVEKDIHIAEIRYEIVVRDVIADLKTAVYELIYLDGAVDITRRNQELLNEILAYAQTNYTEQKTGLNDVFRAESQLAQLDYDLITLQELRAVQQSVINAIVNRPADEEITIRDPSLPMQETPSLPNLHELALTQRQEIRLAALGVEKADETIRLAHRQNLPMFSIGAMYINTGEALNPTMQDSGKDPLIITGGVSVPLWFGKNKARVRHAREGKRKAEQQELSIQNQTAVELRKIYFRLENARRLVELYRDHLLPQAQRSMEIAEEWNRNRSGSVAEILETQSVWLNFNLAYLRARVDHAQAFVQVERIVGGSLQSAFERGEKP
jgi:outer membrane protein TolC